MQLSYFKTLYFESFSSLFQVLLNGTRAAFSPGQIWQIFGVLSLCSALFVLALQTSYFSLLDPLKSAATPGFPLPTLQPGKFL